MIRGRRRKLIIETKSYNSVDCQTKDEKPGNGALDLAILLTII